MGHGLLHLPLGIGLTFRSGLFTVLVLFAAALELSAQTVYWDANGTTAGSGNTGGTWSATGGAANRRWGNQTGTATPALFTSGADAVFSAGTDGTGSFTITVSGTQNVSSILFEEGSPTFSGGTLNFNDATPDLTIASTASLVWSTTAITSSTNALNISNSGVLEFTSSLTFAGTVNLGGGTLRITDATLTFGTLNITSSTTIDFAGTSSALALSSLNILNGATVTIINWSATADTFTTAAWTGAIRDTSGLAPMNQVQFSGWTMEAGWVSGSNQIRPIPEPSTYGAILVGGLAAFFAWRRRKRR